MKVKFGSRFLSLVGVLSALLILFVEDRIERAANASGSRETALVAIVFDDAHHSFRTVLEKMENRNMRGTLYVPTGLIHRYDFHTKWYFIERANKLGWEIGAHTVNHPDLTKISASEAREEISYSAEHLREQGIETVSFAAPYGESNSDIEKIIMEYYSNNRMAWGETVITPENLDVRALPVFDVSYTGTDIRSMETVVKKSMDSSGLAIIVFHKIALKNELGSEAGETLDKYTVMEEDFDRFLETVSGFEKAGQLKTVTVSEGVSELQWRKSAWKGMYEWIKG